MSSADQIIHYQKLCTFNERTVEKIIRSVLPKRIRISNEFKNAVNRCVQVFVLSVSNAAGYHYKTRHLTEDQVIEIIGLMGFPEFTKPLEQLRTDLVEKKSKFRKSKNSNKIDINIKAKNIEENDTICFEKLSDHKRQQNIEDI